MLKNKYEKRLEDVKKLKETQRQAVIDKYSCGMYNGMELVIAIMEDREPVYLHLPEQEQRVVEEPKKGRTIASGKRVIRKAE